MSLFICDKCATIENTATSRYWTIMGTDEPKLCSQCDPAIGQWHHIFKRDKYEDLDPEEQKRVLNRPKEAEDVTL